MLVRSGEVYYRKALPVSSLHEPRATLDQYGAERDNVDLQHQDRGVNETRATPNT